MRFFSIILVAASLTGAYAGTCTWYPGTNITNSFNGPFTMKAYDYVTGVQSPLSLATAVTQPGRTWQVLSPDSGANESFTTFTLDDYTITAHSPDSSVIPVFSVGTLSPPASSNPVAQASQGPWMVFSEAAVADTTENYCSIPQGPGIDGLLSWLGDTSFYLCESTFADVTTTALTYVTYSTGSNGINVLDPSTCHKVMVYLYPAA